MAYRRHRDDDEIFDLEGAWGSSTPRSGFGRIEPDERLEASREAWRRGASYEELFGTDPFRLKARVGDEGENRPSDVAKIETLLDRRGFYDVQSTDGPTGLYSSMLREALEKFQAAADLEVDGIADPGGETITSLSAGLRPGASAGFAKSVEALARGSRSDHPISRVSQAVPIQDHVGQSVGHGTSPDIPRPGDRAPQVGERDVVLPAPALTRDMREEFEQRTGVRLTKTKDGHALVDPTSGGTIAEFPDDVAEEFVRDWKWFSNRIDLLWVVHRSDLTRDQKLSVLNRLLVSVNREKSDIESLPPGDARKAAERRFKEEHDKVETLRRAAHDALDAMGQGRPREHILSSLQEKVFPDLLGFDRSVREFALDVAPGLGNLRSALHLRNGFVRLREAIEDGDWSRAGENGFMMLLDLVGLWPGANVAKSVARGALRVAPHGRAIEASAEIWRMGRQWNNLKHPVDPGRLFGRYLNELPPEVRRRIMAQSRFAFGNANERHLLDLARQIDPAARNPDKMSLQGLGLGPDPAGPMISR